MRKPLTLFAGDAGPWGERRITLHIGRRKVADLWRRRENVEWATWDSRGIGGPNSVRATVQEALGEVPSALLFQGFVTLLRSDECMAVLKMARDIDQGRL